MTAKIVTSSLLGVMVGVAWGVEHFLALFEVRPPDHRISPLRRDLPADAGS